MRMVARLWLLALLCGIACGGDAADPQLQLPRQPTFRNRFIVKWRRSAPADNATGFAAHVHAASGRSGVQMLSLRHDAYSWQSVVQLSGYTPQTPPAERAALLRAVVADPAVQYIVEDRILYPTLAPNVQAPNVQAPNDPFYGYQWHYGPVVSGGVYPSGLTYGMNLPDAWARTTGAASLVAAVLDTGITSHPDLDAKVLQGYDMISPDSPGVFTTANDGDGRDPDPSDPGDWTSEKHSSWHGTHVSGTIGAVTNNSLGVAGVSWGAKILPVRVLGVNGGYTSDISDGMRWAAGLAVGGVPANANPARVINLSLGGDGPCEEPFQEAINAAVSIGAIVVVSAGNSNKDAANTHLCNCEKVVCVAAHGPSGQRAGYSNFGTGVAITAPGGDSGLGSTWYNVLSTLNNGTTVPGSPMYAFYQGTSMASPHVAGLVALMLSLNPNLTWEPVVSILKLTARPFPAPNVAPRNCSTTTCGGGLADAAAALAFVAAMPANDRCEAAIAVACGQTVQGSVQNATALSADPQCGGTTQTTADVWYSLQVSSITPLQVFTYTSNTTFDTQINVYSGSCSNLQCAAGNDNATAGEASSYLVFAPAAGSWLIRVSGAAQARGAFALTVSCRDAPSPSPSPSAIRSPSPSPVNQNSFETATNPNMPIAAFGGTPVAGQGAANAIDGTTTEYSNQGGPGSGFSVTLARPVAVTALRIFTSNESAAQDPSSYELYGSNDNSVLVSSRRATVSPAWVLIASGNVTLPAARNAPGLQVTTTLNFLLVQFSNTQAYMNYLLVFPTLAGSGTSRAGTSTMTISEVQLLRDSTSSNNDNSGLLGLLALLVLPVIIIAALVWYVLTHRAGPAARAEELPVPVPFSTVDAGLYPPAASAPLPMPTHFYGSRPDPYSWHSTPVNVTTPQFAPFSAPPPTPWPADTEVRW